MTLKIQKESNALKFLDNFVNKANAPAAFLNRVAYPMIIEFQKRRWVSQNSTEGAPWRELNPAYERRKLKKYAEYPGGGRHMMIATGRLVDAATMESDEGWKMVKDNRLYITINVPYAKWADKERNFTKFGRQSIDEIKDALKKYLTESKA